MIDLPPAFILILGALLIPFLKGKVKSVYLVALPVLGFINVLGLSEGMFWTVQFLDFDLVFGRIDRFTLIFGNIFSLITIIGFIYILHTRDDLEYMSAMVYAGSSLGVVFAGDLLTLFIFWELLTLCAVGLTLARRKDASKRAAFRYLLVHVTGGLILLAGIVLHIAENGTTAFNFVGLGGWSGILIFVGFGVNCAWPFLHAWLPDAYPEASIGGTVFMATFTTKTAVYVLARGFPGESALLWIGTAMALFPIFYAVIENDLRRVLAYSLINQVGFMMVGIGVGTALSLNGTAAHAYCHILYKALLFMSIGAVIHQTGKSKATELGGLFRSMPLTCIFCCIGAASISAFPLFSGFVSKSMVMTAAAENHHTIVWLALLFASAGVFHHAGIKIPFFAFFSHDSGIRVKEAPTNMLVAMSIAAFLCIFLAFPVSGYKVLYGLLPFPTDYNPYTFGHVNGQFLLLLFSALAFTLLLLSGYYPSEKRAINLDADWFYRKGGVLFYNLAARLLNGLNTWTQRIVVDGLVGRLSANARIGPIRIWARLMKVYWTIGGRNEAEIEKRRNLLLLNARGSTFPIGATAVLAALLMGVLIVL
ncbi:MAG: Na(+)/H(+) antiporter subunit D [Opitutaceae bacterium]